MQELGVYYYSNYSEIGGVKVVSAYGNVEYIVELNAGRKRGFAFIDLNDQNSEKRIIDDLQDLEWMGIVIRVNVAEQKK